MLDYPWACSLYLINKPAFLKFSGLISSPSSPATAWLGMGAYVCGGSAWQGMSKLGPSIQDLYAQGLPPKKWSTGSFPTKEVLYLVSWKGVVFLMI